LASAYPVNTLLSGINLEGLEYGWNQLEEEKIRQSQTFFLSSHAKMANFKRHNESLALFVTKGSPGLQKKNRKTVYANFERHSIRRKF